MPISTMAAGKFMPEPNRGKFIPQFQCQRRFNVNIPTMATFQLVCRIRSHRRIFLEFKGTLHQDQLSKDLQFSRPSIV
jgi:hypothetical protein